MANTARARGAGSTRAAPSAPAMKGPLHGMAMKAASAPVENAPRKPLVWLPRAANAGIGNSNRPARFKAIRSEEHTSELQSLMRISYAVFCLKKKKTKIKNTHKHLTHHYTNNLAHYVTNQTIR